MIDVAAYVGSYPFRHLPHPDPDVLVRVLERERLAGAWVGYLPSVWQRDPAPGNTALFAALEPYPTLRPAPIVRPDWPRWEHTLEEALDRGAAAIRAQVLHVGIAADLHINAGARQLRQVRRHQGRRTPIEGEWRCRHAGKLEGQQFRDTAFMRPSQKVNGVELARFRIELSLADATDFIATGLACRPPLFTCGMLAGLSWHID